jgi:thiol-disulfide isomerase/thioredoxin
VTRRLAGEGVKGLDVADVTSAPAATAADDGPATLPSLALNDINGQTIDPARFAGRAVVVELWATWCPPCKSTMAWLPSLQSQYSGRAVVLAIAVDSDPKTWPPWRRP